MDVAHLWPVLTSYDDLSKYAQVKGGRLPTEAELRLFLDNFAIGYEGGANIGFRNWHPVPYVTSSRFACSEQTFYLGRPLADRRTAERDTMVVFGNGHLPFLKHTKVL